ncbi:MAG: hypothetical protein KKH68_11155 [Proteobacteria bacterium]|nr:hypothetical protein [Pseudomonadota bacterium]
MKKDFKPNGLPVLIGSLPMNDHDEAIKLVLEHTPQIPLWVQLPGFREEGMIAQFLPGIPGLATEKGRNFINTAGPDFDGDIVQFYEEYLAVTEGAVDLEDSRFVLKPDTARGFFTLLKGVETFADTPVALKGQITGPITFGLGTTDENRKAIFYNDQLRDAAVKLLALKARWQVRALSKFGCPVIMFLDEPALAGFGSSAFISISRDEVVACLNEVIDAVQSEGGLAGVHVCANTDWSLILESSADIVSFDAYSYFDKFMLYAGSVKKFLESGGIIAWGIVPTSSRDDIQKETTGSLVAKWQEQVRVVDQTGVEPSRILAQSLITPSCGTGSLSLDLATKVLRLTREVSDTIRSLS